MKKGLITAYLFLGLLLVFSGLNIASASITVISQDEADSIYGGCGTYCSSSSCGSGSTCISRDQGSCSGTSNVSSTPKFSCPTTSNPDKDCQRSNYGECSNVFTCVWSSLLGQCRPIVSGEDGNSGYRSCTD